MTFLLQSKRKDAKANRRFILQFIDGIERSAPEIAKMVGVTESGIRRHLNAMHELGEIHIKRWYRPGIKYVALWIAGPGEDAPEPKALPNYERMKNYRDLIRADPERHMRYLNTMRAYRARVKAKKQAGKPDVAAAWITSQGPK